MDFDNQMFANRRRDSNPYEKDTHQENFSMPKKKFLNSSNVDNAQKWIRSRKTG